jgi:hypothetical protein
MKGDRIKQASQIQARRIRMAREFKAHCSRVSQIVSSKVYVAGRPQIKELLGFGACTRTIIQQRDDKEGSVSLSKPEFSFMSVLFNHGET